MADSPSFKLPYIYIYIIKSASNPILPPKNALETEKMDRLLYVIKKEDALKQIWI